MKKRLPTIILLLSVAILLATIILWPKSQAPQDSDKDGFPDNIDECPTVFSETNLGCPLKEIDTPNYRVDKDKDGYFNIQMDKTELLDPNDDNPCDPDIECAICDYDGDNLTREEENMKGTDPNLKDSDGDGVDDDKDKCPVKFGHADANGCILEVNADLDAVGKTVSWNPILKDHVENLMIEIYSYVDSKVILTKSVSIEKGMYQIDRNKLTDGYTYKVSLKITPKSSRGVQFSNTEKNTNF